MDRTNQHQPPAPDAADTAVILADAEVATQRLSALSAAASVGGDRWRRQMCDARDAAVAVAERVIAASGRPAQAITYCDAAFFTSASAGILLEVAAATETAYFAFRAGNSSAGDECMRRSDVLRALFDAMQASTCAMEGSGESP
ncbi:hypothetical protein [Xenophilus azovorans]|uniref:hypothetical protein n=1 Tax=Xenophilus azovorans TaxID=151755 RepID=UPI00056FDFEA|nr:hypothetical protein [Xenophilus azovorans]